MIRPCLSIVAAVVIALFAGCPSAPQPATAPAAQQPVARPLALLVVDDPELGQAIAAQWRSRTEEDLQLSMATTPEVAAARRLPCDVVIYPAGLIGQLAEGNMIAPLDSAALAAPEFAHRDILDHIRLREMKWGHRTFAAPLGSPQLLLAYRADILERLGVAPPGDWAAYHQLANRLSDRALLADQLGQLAPPADQPWRGTVEPLAVGFPGQLLLTRAAAYALNHEELSPLFRYASLQPLIDHPPYVQALAELVAAAETGGFAELRLTPDQAIAEVTAGRAAMALGWPAPTANASVPSPTTADASARLAFTLLPGSPRAYSFAQQRFVDRDAEDSPHVPLLSVAGRLASVSTSAADPRRAEGFVLWLAGREMSDEIGPRSGATTLFRASQVASPVRWTGGLSPAASRSYAEALSQSLTLPRAIAGLTLPGRQEYLAALDQAVLDALSGQSAPADALAAAAKQWSEITQRLGTDTQRRANSRSIGQAE